MSMEMQFRKKKMAHAMEYVTANLSLILK